MGSSAADTWPIVNPVKDLAEFEALMCCGTPTIEPRLTPVPVRMPLPDPDKQGSIYENQKGLKNRPFDVV